VLICSNVTLPKTFKAFFGSHPHRLFCGELVIA
jgi:hypothetical protein